MNYTPDLTIATVKMILALAVVLALLWAAQRWMKRALPAGRVGGKDRLIKVLSNHPVGIKKSVALIQVPGKVLVLGIGTEQVNLLAQIDDPKALADLASEDERKSGTSFSEQLQRMTRNLRRPADKASAIDDQGGIA